MGHEMTGFGDVDSLRHSGFTGFERVDALWAKRLASVPKEAGVYVVIRPAMSAPEFLGASTAGQRNGRDPTVDVTKLRLAWVPSARVLYIGKAGGGGTKATLRSRLRAYLAHGLGRSASHWGGRYIWQLADAATLVLAWRPEREPRAVERLLIQSFQAVHGKRPFANRRR